jgi:putative ABC transport system ATP-binding protein
MAIIEIENLTKRYGEVNALDRVMLAVEKGEWIAVMGPSGSGKSTLLNIIGGLDSPTEGRVVVDGQDLARLSPAEVARFRAEKIGFIFQQFHLVPYLTAVENVMLAQYFHSLAEEKEAEEALRRVGMGDRLQHLPSQLSGGEQQRVCVARALINQPNLILADEPTGNLDEVNEAIVMGLMTELHREGHTIVLVTHDLEIGRMAERRIELHHGRLAEATVLLHYEEELVDDLLHAVWKAREENNLDPVPAAILPEYVESRATFNLMAAGGWIELSDGLIRFTGKGEERATLDVRRHRLAECLFHMTFGLDIDLLDENAHQIEHTLSPQVTERICTFLRHPSACPHGSPIPRGVCCLKAQSV